MGHAVRPATVILALHAIDRSFGAVQVLHGVDIELAPGEVHALIGENGAGKSTTMKIISGYLAPTAGRITLDGEDARFASSQDAEARGHRADPPGVQPRPAAHRRAERLPGPRAAGAGRSSTSGRCATAPARSSTGSSCRASPTAQVRDISNVGQADGGDRQGAVARRPRPDHGRADRGADERARRSLLFAQVDRLRASGVAILFTSPTSSTR